MFDWFLDTSLYWGASKVSSKQIEVKLFKTEMQSRI